VADMGQYPTFPSFTRSHARLAITQFRPTSVLFPIRVIKSADRRKTIDTHAQEKIERSSCDIKFHREMSIQFFVYFCNLSVTWNRNENNPRGQILDWIYCRYVNNRTNSPARNNEFFPKAYFMFSQLLNLPGNTRVTCVKVL